MAKSPKKPTTDEAEPVPAKAADFVVTDETTDEPATTAEINVLQEWPAFPGVAEYQSHKIVRALRIDDVETTEQAIALGFYDPEYGTRFWLLSHDLMPRYKPVAGDYVVIYADGYTSISPRQAFEDGYTPMPTDDKIAARQASIDETLNAAIHGILAYARNLPPAKPIEVGDLDAMRATARIHLQNFLS